MAQTLIHTLSYTQISMTKIMPFRYVKSAQDHIEV
jgi:hypothetical protein